MRSISKIFFLGMIFTNLSACVTTREQLNEEKGIGVATPRDSGAPTKGDIKSEDITPKVAPPPVAASVPVPTPMPAPAIENTNPVPVGQTLPAPANYVTPIQNTGTTSANMPMQTGGTMPAQSGTMVPIQTGGNTSAPIGQNLTIAPGTTGAPVGTGMPVSQTGAPLTAPVNGNLDPSLGTGTTTGVPPLAVAPVPVATPRPDLSSYSPDELRSEVAQLSGKLEENEHNQHLTEQAHLEETKKAQARIDELEKKLKELQPDAPTVPQGKTPFEAGKDDVLSNNCDEAIVFLSQSLMASDVGKEAEEATYLRGDCYFKKSQYNKAIVDFSHFPEKYQKSSFHPKALLRIAESFEAMGRKDDAKAFYSDLLDKFPKTAEGKLAKKRLKAKK